MRLFFLLVLLALLLALNLSAEQFTWTLIQESITSWTIAKLAPSILTVLGALTVGAWLFKSINRTFWVRFIISTFAFLLVVISFLIVNKPYIEDYAKEGKPMEATDNSILNDHLVEEPNFTGLIMVASSSCPHCMSSAEKLSTLKHRVPMRNVDVYLFTTKQEVIEEFKEDTQSENLTYHTIHDETAALSLCDGRFPAFIYLKEGKPVRRWFNNDFGYPAYDLVENGLK